MTHSVSIPVNGGELRGWKLDFGEKSAGVCSAYGVIAPSHDLIQSKQAAQSSEKFRRRISFLGSYLSGGWAGTKRRILIHEALRRPFQKSSWDASSLPVRASGKMQRGHFAYLPCFLAYLEQSNKVYSFLFSSQWKCIFEEARIQGTSLKQ